MSPVQYGMVVESLRTPGQGVYVLQKRFSIRHHINVELLDEALQLVVACHSTLRTRFVLDDVAGPSQAVSPEVDVTIVELDCSPLSPEAQRRAAADYLAGDLARGFSLAEAAPPMRFALLRYSEEAYDFVWTSHHAMLDGHSWMIILAQLFDTYDALCAGQRPTLQSPRPYSSYVRWRETRDRAKEQAFWSAQLAGASLPTALGVAGSPALPSQGEATFATTVTDLGKESSHRMYALAERMNVSAHNWVQAAWSILLHQASGCDDIVFGTTRACRSFAADAHERIGVFLNTLPLRVTMTSDMTVTELVHNLRNRNRILRDNEYSGAGEIRQWAQLPVRTALFESVVVFENYQVDAYFYARGGSWEKRHFSFNGNTSFPLTLSAYRGSELTLQLDYDRRICADDAAEMVSGHLLKLLEEAVADPNARVGMLPRLSPAALAGYPAGAEKQKERRFWSGRLSNVEVPGMPSHAEGASGEIRVQAPLDGAVNSVSLVDRWDCTLRRVAGAIAFFARLAGDDGGRVGLRQFIHDDPSEQHNFNWVALPVCDRPQPLSSLQADMERHLSGAGSPGEPGTLECRSVPAIALEIVTDLDSPPERMAGTVMLLQFPQRNDELRCVVDTDLVPPGCVDALCTHLSALLAAIPRVEDADLMVLPLLTRSQRRRVLETWNATATDYPSELCVHHLIAEQAARQPDAVAVKAEDETLTYGELAQRSAGLAGTLAAQGIGRDSAVGVCLERSVALVVALLGVLRSGATFIPLDPHYPQQRITHMVEGSRLKLIVTDTRAEASVRDSGAPLMVLDGDQNAIVGDVESEWEDATPDDIAYVIYTSGSTGRPKGVRVRHQALTNLLCAMAASPGFSAADELLALTTICFDISYLELFLPLISGGRVIVCPSEVTSNGVALRETIERMRPTVIQATPSAWKMLIAAGWEGDPHLKVLCGGEDLPTDLADALTARAGEVWNLYGPTETTIWSSAARVRRDSRVTIGHPIANTCFYVLDCRGQPVIPGLLGELHIGGDGVSAGYLDDPQLTQDRFLPGPVGRTTVYRTGDIVRQLYDGRIEYLGRADNQVKYNGHRIELSEVEHALREHPAVTDAVVALRQAAGRQTLVGYLVAADTAVSLSPSVLRHHLEEKLPDYMVPSMFIALARLPLTANRKGDRGALPDPSSSQILTDIPYAPPRAGVERTIAEIWRELLGLDKVGVHETFFDLGGDSVALVQLIERLRAQVADHVTHVDAFEFPTIRAMANHLAEGSDAPETSLMSRSTSDRASRLAELRSRRHPHQTPRPFPACVPPTGGKQE
jgi:amino acid adenylation domain-containing protein